LVPEEVAAGAIALLEIGRAPEGASGQSEFWGNVITDCP